MHCKHRNQSNTNPLCGHCCLSKPQFIFHLVWTPRLYLVSLCVPSLTSFPCPSFNLVINPDQECMTEAVSCDKTVTQTDTSLLCRLFGLSALAVSLLRLQGAQPGNINLLMRQSVSGVGL